MNPCIAPLRSGDYTVETVPLSVCKELVERYHYSGGGSNTATFRHGLIRRADSRILGCAWWIPPTKNAARAAYPKNWRSVLNLSRLVVVPEAPKNAASFLIAASIRLIRADGRFEYLLTYADDWRGHCGSIYRATNWTYLGKTKPERTYTLNGRMVARKAGPKTRTHAEMMAIGAVLEGSFSKHRFGMNIGSG